MAHERGNCKDSCLSDKRNCYHNIACTIVRQFRNGRWLIENQYHYVKAIDPESMVFEEHEYQTHHNPNAAPQHHSFPSYLGITKVEERNNTDEDFNAKLIRLRNMKENDPVNTHIDINGSVGDANHWSESDKAWHTKDCKIITR